MPRRPPGTCARRPSRPRRDDHVPGAQRVLLLDAAARCRRAAAGRAVEDRRTARARPSASAAGTCTSRRRAPRDAGRCARARASCDEEVLGPGVLALLVDVDRRVLERDDARRARRRLGQLEAARPRPRARAGRGLAGERPEDAAPQHARAREVHERRVGVLAEAQDVEPVVAGDQRVGRPAGGIDDRVARRRSRGPRRRSTPGPSPPSTKKISSSAPCTCTGPMRAPGSTSTRCTPTAVDPAAAPRSRHHERISPTSRRSRSTSSQWQSVMPHRPSSRRAARGTTTPPRTPLPPKPRNASFCERG